jgi:hypothetical protein
MDGWDGAKSITGSGKALGLGMMAFGAGAMVAGALAALPTGGTSGAVVAAGEVRAR